MAKAIGLHEINDEGNAFLTSQGIASDKLYWESLYLKTGDKHMVSRMLELYNLDKSVLPPEMGGGKDDGESIFIPQEQCDVDHCLHRMYLICNSIYLCHPVSHTANQCNSIIRKGCGEWCYGIGYQEYVRGE